jgi:DNA-binding transcriptional LysR family regulator
MPEQRHRHLRHRERQRKRVHSSAKGFRVTRGNGRNEVDRPGKRERGRESTDDDGDIAAQPHFLERALEEVGLRRDVTVVVGGFSAALALARSVDLVATVPARHTGSLRAGMHAFPLPFAMPEMTVSLLWHPRMDSDAAHRWLRGVVIGISRE